MSLWDEILGGVSDTASNIYNNVSDYVGSAVNSAGDYWSTPTDTSGFAFGDYGPFSPIGYSNPYVDTSGFSVGDYGPFTPVSYTPAPDTRNSEGGLSNLWGFTDWADRNEKGLNALGKWGVPAIGAGISMWDASKKNKLLKKQQREMSARQAAVAAEKAKYNSPVTFQNRRAALAAPTESGGQAVWFANNQLPTSFTEASPYAQMAEGGALGYLDGGTPGQSDKIPAMLSDGEFVIDADTVSALGDGNNAAGASALEQMRQNIRAHKRKAPVNKIPPKAKKPEQYLKKEKK